MAFRGFCIWTLHIYTVYKYWFWTFKWLNYCINIDFYKILTRKKHNNLTFTIAQTCKVSRKLRSTQYTVKKSLPGRVSWVFPRGLASFSESFSLWEADENRLQHMRTPAWEMKPRAASWAWDQTEPCPWRVYRFTLMRVERDLHTHTHTQ